MIRFLSHVEATLQRETSRESGERGTKSVPEIGSLFFASEICALRPFPRALARLSLLHSSITTHSYRSRAAEAAPRVPNHLRLKRRDVGPCRARSAAGAIGAKRGALARQGRGPTRPTSCYNSSHAAYAQVITCGRRSASGSQGQDSAPPKRLATHGTGCRTDSEDAWLSKSRGIMLQVHKTPASNTTPPKALPKAQRDASGAARRRWLGEAPCASTLQ